MASGHLASQKLSTFSFRNGPSHATSTAGSAQLINDCYS